ncbi:MAG: hypothetical protein OSB70_00785 [Myxococcota bacterium]|jgi:hypothetical protein|nr:hypothetical protein [Myxococcota bacterium]
MLRIRRSLALAACLIPVGFGPALAQIAFPSVERDAPQWNAKVGGAARYQMATAIDTGGNFETLQYTIAAWAEGPLTESIQLGFDASYSHTAFEFGAGSGAACADPAACFSPSAWQDVHRLDLSPQASLLLTPAIRLRFMVPIRWNAANQAEAGAITAGAVAVLQWKLSSTLTAGLGIGIRSALGEDSNVYPAISLDWKIGSELRLQTRGGPYQGGEVALVWSPSETFQGVLTAGYQRQRFRLATGGANPNGIGQETSVPLLAALELRFSPRLRIVAQGGMAVAGELSIEDALGNRLVKSGFDSAGLVRGYATVSF